MFEQKSGFRIPKSGYQFFVYSKGYVRDYINMAVVDDIIAYILKRIEKNRAYFNHVENKFWKHSEFLDPYLYGKAVISGKQEFKKFVDISCEWWAHYTVAYWASYFPSSKISKVIFQRAEKMRLSNNNIIFCFNEAFRNGIKKLFGRKFKNEYYHLTIKEILDSKIPKNLLERENPFIYFKNKIYYQSLEEFVKQKGIQLPKLEGAEEAVKGQVAYPGKKIKGRVKICLFDKKLPKFKKGEILVSSMTMPNFLPAIKKAAAIVTDEGGMTCHASIIAREMKKPCIVGTKIATQIFKDGDIVEVDAGKGIVKKLKYLIPNN
ncbi:MAG: PEP-utilizing enzyme [Patescibacteria group bacterium]